MTEGQTCYENDEAFCEDQMCLRTGCKLKNAHANLPAPIEFSEALVRQIAMDVGKQVVAHIESMYPQMFGNVSAKSASLSIRNTAYNAIMEAVKAANKGEVEQMLERHDTHRRTIRKLRKASSVEEIRDIIRS